MLNLVGSCLVGWWALGQETAKLLQKLSPATNKVIEEVGQWNGVLLLTYQDHDNLLYMYLYTI